MTRVNKIVVDIIQALGQTQPRKDAKGHLQDVQPRYGGVGFHTRMFFSIWFYLVVFIQPLSPRSDASCPKHNRVTAAIHWTEQAAEDTGEAAVSGPEDGDAGANMEDPVDGKAAEGEKGEKALGKSKKPA